MTIKRNFSRCVESEDNFLKTPSGEYQWEIPEAKRIRNLIPRGQSPGWMNIWTKMSKDSEKAAEIIEDFFDKKHRRFPRKNLNLENSEKEAEIVTKFISAAKFHDDELTDNYDGSTYCPPKGSSKVLPCKRNSRRRRNALDRFSRTMSSRAIKSYQVTKFQYGLKDRLVFSIASYFYSICDLLNLPICCVIHSNY